MKRAWLLLIAAALTLVGARANLSGQEQAPATQVFFGPVLGVDAVVIDPSGFNETMQTIYPKSEGTYFPVFTEMGIQSTQFFPLGNTKSSLAIHELFMIAGLDQNMPVPTVDLLFGYHFGWGLEGDLGSHFTLVAPGAAVRIGASMMYWVGWWFTFQGFSLPVKLTFVPLPSYTKPKISLLFGISFQAL